MAATWCLCPSSPSGEIGVVKTAAYLCVLLLGQIGPIPDVDVRVVVAADKPKTTIIHIRDWHYVDKEGHRIDLEHVKKRKLTDEEAEKAFADFLDDVEQVQAEQEKVVRHLAGLGHRRFLLEGLTSENFESYPATLRIGEMIVERKLTDLKARILPLRLGAILRPAIEKLITIGPLEDEKVLNAARSFKDGKRTRDPIKMEARDKAIVEQCLKEDGTVVIVLGANHKLGPLVEKLGQGRCSYVTITTEKVKKLMVE